MTKLVEQKCEACRADAPRVTDDELPQLSAEVPDWSVVIRDGVPQLERVFKFSSYLDGLAFTGRVGELAESEDHHPSLLTEWGKVTVTWWTHKIRGLHRNDFIMAARTDRLI